MTEVGVDKPIGYLPRYTLEAMGEHGRLLGEDAVRQGLVVASFGPDECCIKSRAFYFYDQEALAKLLEQHAEALSAAHMTADPDKFIAAIAAHWLPGARASARLLPSRLATERIG